MISLAVICSRQGVQPRFQTAPFQPGVVARIDTVSGAIELCGHMDFVLPLFPTADFKPPPGSDPKHTQDLKDLMALSIQLAERDRCFELNNGTDANRQ